MSDNRRSLPLGVLATFVALVALACPLFLQTFWLQLGLFAMAAMVGAFGLTLLVGVAGQLSLAHAFFAALGAYSYAWFAGGGLPGDVGGLGLPPIVSVVLAVGVSGFAGALFSPIAGRLRGVYLGLASLGLVFVGRHLIVNLEGLTGGFTGRGVQPFEIFGFAFANASPDYLAILGVEIDGVRRLWYMFFVVAVGSGIVARNIKASRTGRALSNLRDSEAAAAAMGVHVARAKATAFVVSSSYAGLAGVLMGLGYSRISPDLFGLQLSIDFLMMVVLGGLGSIAGAAVGAAFVVALPFVFTQYGSAIPFLADPGSPGLDAAAFAKMLYAAAIIGVLIFLRGGLASLVRVRRRVPPSVDRPTGGQSPGAENPSDIGSSTAART